MDFTPTEQIQPVSLSTPLLSLVVVGDRETERMSFVAPETSQSQFCLAEGTEGSWRYSQMGLVQ